MYNTMKICSLSTLAREYVAMRSISHLPYKDMILTPADSIHKSEDQTWKISKPLMEYIQSNHNSTQLEAIRAGLSRRKFVLVQGPPGTGKTQTILGLLSAMLHATPARIHTKGKISEIKHMPNLHTEDKNNQWAKASPWLSGINPRDAKMPQDADDGYFPTTSSELKPEVVNCSRKYRVRILVCAPSNSALDEIVLRILSTGIRDENDRAYTPKIVRIGLKAHHSVQSVSMDYLVEQKLAGMNFQTADKQKQGGATMDTDTIRALIMDESAIVFSTLSFSGSSLFTKLNRTFDIVVINEAAQAVEPATLVPLIASRCKQVFLVGDPVQLPATVISSVAEKFGYSMSLFRRFQKAGYPVQMLKTQYRMHPEVVGSADAHELWKNLVASAEERDVLFKVSKPYADFFSDNNLASMTPEEAVPEALGPDDMDTDALGYDQPPPFCEPLKMDAFIQWLVWRDPLAAFSTKGERYGHPLSHPSYRHVNFFFLPLTPSLSPVVITSYHTKL